MPPQSAFAATNAGLVPPRTRGREKRVEATPTPMTNETRLNQTTHVSCGRYRCAKPIASGDEIHIDCACVAMDGISGRVEARVTRRVSDRAPP